MQNEYSERLKSLKDDEDGEEEGLLHEKNFRCLERFFDGDNLGRYSYYLSRTIKICEIAGICRKTGKKSAARRAEKLYKKSLENGDNYFAVVYLDAACQFRNFTDEQFKEIAGSGK